MAQWQVTFKGGSTMKVEDATQTGAESTGKFFEASRGRVTKVQPIKVEAKAKA